jgi:hypothetical protein
MGPNERSDTRTYWPTDRRSQIQLRSTPHCETNRIIIVTVARNNMCLNVGNVTLFMFYFICFLQHVCLCFCVFVVTPQWALGCRVQCVHQLRTTAVILVKCTNCFSGLCFHLCPSVSSAFIFNWVLLFLFVTLCLLHCLFTSSVLLQCALHCLSAFDFIAVVNACNK